MQRKKLPVGKGFSVSTIQFMCRFYQAYQIQQIVSVKLSWSHYCELLSISALDKRSFYEKEALIEQVEAVLKNWHEKENKVLTYGSAFCRERCKYEWL